jgi:hypothetical protein
LNRNAAAYWIPAFAGMTTQVDKAGGPLSLVGEGWGTRAALAIGLSSITPGIEKFLTANFKISKILDALK